MKRQSAALAAFALMVALAAGTASAQEIVYTFTGLRSAVDGCKWFNDNLTDRSIDALTRQTDMLYNRLALPAGAPVTVVGTSVTEVGEQLVDFKLNSSQVCGPAQAIYGITSAPAATP
ncbi:MAG: hypothetical protein WCC84_11460 [Candidatus Cybelea sp.]